MTDEKRKEILEYFKNMKPFNGDVNKIPHIPFVDKDDYKNIIVPNLIRCGAIPKSKLIKGRLYIGECRNANEAIWNGEVFVYDRTKFGFTYKEDINHFEDDNGYDLFVPLAEKKAESII